MTRVVDDEAICIRHWDYSESSQTIGLFVRSAGMVRAIAKGSRRAKGEFSGGVDLLTLGHASLLVKPTTELATLRSWMVLESFHGVRKDLLANRRGYYAADLVGRLFEAHDPHPTVFDGLKAFLLGLCDRVESRGAGNPDAAESTLLEFQWLLLKEAGFQPRLGALGDEDTVVNFDPRAGGELVAAQTDTSWRVRVGTIRAIMQLSLPSDAQPGDQDQAAVARANRLLAAYAREVMGDEPHTMRSLFGELTPSTRRMQL